MKVSKSVAKNKACHSVNHRSIETFFFLLAVFLLERFIYCVHHWNGANTCFCFRERYSKLTFCCVGSPGIICNTMVYADYPLFKIYILPPQSDYFANPAPRTQQHCKKWCPVAIYRTFSCVVHKGSLLLQREGMAHTMIFPRFFLNLSHHSIARIISDDVISHCKLECRVENGVDCFKRVNLQSLFIYQMIIEVQHI